MTVQRKGLRGRILPLVFIAAFGLIGATLYLLTRASTNVLGIDISSNLAVAPVTAVSDPNAVGGSAVQFKQATTAPASTATAASNCKAFGTQPSLALPSTCYAISVDGQQRTFALNRPAGTNSNSVLVVVLHPSGSSSMYYEELTSLGGVSFDAQASTNNYVVAYVDGIHKNALRNDGTTTGNNPAWWSGATVSNPVYPATTSFDDVHLIDAIIADVTGPLAFASPSKVYVIGSSAGALMVHRQACDGVVAVRAFISVSGAIKDACTPFNAATRNFSLLEIHGDADTAVPYAGFTDGGGQVIPSSPTIMASWAARMGCGTKTTTNVALPGKSAVLDSWTNSSGACAGKAVELLTILSGGHSWAQGLSTSLITPYIITYINSH